MLTRRAFATTSLALAAASAVRAQNTGNRPERPVTVVVPWPAGGPTDAFARLLSQRLSTDLGHPFVVDNRGGANGTIGMTSAARARPDGYTAVITPNSTYAVAPHLYQVPYDRNSAFARVGLLVSSPLFMLVPRNSPVRTVAEYVELAKRPGSKLDYANAGVGATSHLATEMFLQTAGIEVTEVGYRGSGPAIQAVLAGEAGMLFMPAAAVMSYIQSGDLRPLAATTRERSPLAPEVPTLQESFPDAEGALETIIAVLGPAGMPAATVARLDEAIRAALTRPALQERFSALSTAVLPLTASALAARIRADNARWEALIRQAGIEPE